MYYFFSELQKEFRFRDWVKVSQNAPRVVNVAAGDRVEFDCEAIGSPSPSVQWSRGPRPLTPVSVIKYITVL